MLNLESVLVPSTTPAFLAAAFMTFLGAWLLYLNFNDLAHRTFALFLFLRSAVLVLGTLRSLPEASLAEAAFFDRLIPYFLLPVVPVIAYFASVYPRRRGWLGRSRLGTFALLFFVVWIEILYFARHDFLWHVEPRVGDVTTFASAGGHLVYTDFGPLALLVGLVAPSYGLLALLFSQGYIHAPPESRRLSWFFVAIGFALNALFDGTVQLIGLFQLLGSDDAFPWLPWGWAFALLPSLVAVPTVAAIVLLARHAATTDDDRMRRSARRFFFVAPLPVLSALFLVLLGPRAAFLADARAQFILGIWRLALPTLVSYSLLRHQLFDIDLRVKWTISKGTVAAAFLATFFIGGQVAQNYFTARYDWAWGGAAAGLLLFALSPLQRFAEGLARRALPEAKPAAEMTERERQALYKEQASLAWEDGTLNRKERLMLDTLRQHLGLSHEEAGRLELEGTRAALDR